MCLCYLACDKSAAPFCLQPYSAQYADFSHERAVNQTSSFSAPLRLQHSTDAANFAVTSEVNLKGSHRDFRKKGEISTADRSELKSTAIDAVNKTVIKPFGKHVQTFLHDM